MDTKGTVITWLGHATFKFETTEGKIVVVDPWIAGNPSTPDDQKDQREIDLMLITHGHFDHIADAVDLGTKLKPQTFAIPETSHWLNGKGVPNVGELNKGGTVEAQGVKFTMTHAVHSCGITDGDTIVYGGEAAGYVLEFPGGLKVYHAGDTGPFSDMKIIADLYEPDICLLPIGGWYTMSPKEAAYACGLLSAKTVIPMHFGTFPILTGTPDELAKLVGNKTEVIEMTPGQSLESPS